MADSKKTSKKTSKKKAVAKKKVTTKKAAVKKAAVTKDAASKKAVTKKVAAKKKKVATKKVAAKQTIKWRITREQRWQMVAEAAYLRAEARGFSGGGDVGDWLAAEQEVDAMLQKDGVKYLD